jgi:ATP-dependent RNA helicase RhlE
VTFEQFTFHPQVNAGIFACGYTTPTPIQAQTIPSILQGRDVLGLAQTGTGKTAAFVLPILQRLVSRPRGRLRALIISPTRELSEQTHQSIRTLGGKTGLRSLTLYGGVSLQPQIRGLREGADIAVACPGRLLDLLGQGKVNLNSIEIVVLDEADHMFDMGFLPDIRRILKALPNNRQTLLFSATMPDEVRGLATEMLHNPETIEIGIDHPLETVSHAAYPVQQTQKTQLLLTLLRTTGNGQVLVFTRTKHRAKKLSEQLIFAGVSATSLQGNLSQNKRMESMDRFRSGKARVMVATDIAARGIDVSQVTHVINYDIPDTADAYTHRTGRTGRMTRLGEAYSLVTPEDVLMVRTIERLLGKRLERRTLGDFNTPDLDQQIPLRQAPPRTRQAQQPQRRPRQGSPVRAHNSSR